MTLQRRTGCLNCAVRDQALCQVLSPADLAKLNRQAYHKRFSAGQLLTGLTAAQGWCATILSGVVKLTKSLPDGRQQIVGLLFPADFLGRPWGRSLSTNSACWQAEAVTALELCCYSTHAFEQLLAEQPNLKQLFLQRTLDAVDAAHEWMLLLGCKRASERVAALLLMLAQRLKPPNGATTAKPLPPLIELPLSRADIAEYLGLRLETVSRQLNRLEAAGVIKRCDRRGIALVQRRRARAPVGRSLPRAALTLSGPPSLPRSGATPASAWPQRGPASAITVYLGPITKARLCRI